MDGAAPGFVFESRLKLAPRLRLENPPDGGARLSVPVLDGEFEGPRLRGKVLNHGGEFAHVRSDGVFSFDARYFMQEQDGTLIYLQNRGYRHGPPDVMERAVQARRATWSIRRCTIFAARRRSKCRPGPHDWLTAICFHRCRISR